VNWELVLSLSMKMKTSILVCIVLVLPLVLSTAFVPADAGKPNEEKDKKSIQICCSWGEQLEDGKLTYRINEGDASIREAVRSAVNQWDVKIDGLSLQEVEEESSSVDIDIGFKKDGKHLPGERSKHGLMTAGLTSFELSWRNIIDEVHITLAKGVRGHEFSPPQIELVAQHEMGHALGLGHSNSRTSIMSPTINSQQSGSISECEINAVLRANAWKLMDSDSNSRSSRGSSMQC
jgi:predicted Zn-dependent protease